MSPYSLLVPRCCNTFCYSLRATLVTNDKCCAVWLQEFSSSITEEKEHDAIIRGFVIQRNSNFNKREFVLTRK